MSMISFIVELIGVTIQITQIVFTSWIKAVLCFLPDLHAGKEIGNDVVLITGGGRGLGRMVAMEFAKHKPKHIILWGRNEKTLQATATEVTTSSSVPCTYMVCDVGNDKQVTQQADRLRSEVGDVSILVNNAGIVCAKHVHQMTMDEIEKVIQVNTLGQIRVLKAFLPAMMTMNHGHLVSVNSIMGLMSLAGAADYTASKYALSGFMDAVRHELAETDIKVTSVHPYLVDTGMFDGFQPRFAWLYPPLNEQYVAEMLVKAVLTDQTDMMMPRIMYAVILSKSLLPTKATMVLQKFFGLNTAMRGFQQQQQRLRHQE